MLLSCDHRLCSIGFLGKASQEDVAKSLKMLKLIPPNVLVSRS